MPSNQPNQTASPAIVATVVAVLTYLILGLSGNGIVDDYRQVSTRTSVAILAVLKEQRLWVALAMGVLVFLWARQLQRRAPALSDSEFLKWSANLPQWRPQQARGETAVFLVPQGPSQPRAVAAAAGAAPVGAPVVPVAGIFSGVQADAAQEVVAAPAVSVPVLRLAPLQEMAGKFAMARAAGMMPAAPVRMPLQPVAAQGGALAKAGRLDIPARLDLPALAKLPRAEFEKIAGELYRRQGYDVAALGGGDDAGVDLIMTGKSEVLIAKCWLQPEPVPVESVRELLALVMQEGATRGILLTPGDFSRKALKFANSRGRHRLQLVNGRQFQTLMEASATGASPACPCCGGRTLMVDRRKSFGRSQKLWQCSRAPECDGVIHAGRGIKTPPQPARPLLAGA